MRIIWLLLITACGTAKPPAHWVLSVGHQDFDCQMPGVELEGGSVVAELSIGESSSELSISECRWLLYETGESFVAPAGQFCRDDGRPILLLELTALASEDSLVVDQIHGFKLEDGTGCKVASSYEFTPL